MRVRSFIKNGAHVIAPCPHDDACPLVKPDWCHFSQRLQRSRVHKQLKSAELPYEDEKFIYVALSRAPIAQRPSRVLAQPVTTKIEITAKLCTNAGVIAANAPRRDKAKYAKFRKLDQRCGYLTHRSSLRAQRSNPVLPRLCLLDCFVAALRGKLKAFPDLAMTWRESGIIRTCGRCSPDRDCVAIHQE